MEPNIVIEEKEKLIKNLAAKLIELIKLSPKEKLNIALSGGSTPNALYDIIAREHHNSVDWSKVYFWFGDERCVPPDDDDSNFKMVNEVMFDRLKLPYRHIYRIEGESNPENEVVNYIGKMERYLPNKNSIPYFDIVLLGMGEDGHTVSIFPDQINLFNSRRPAEAAVHPETGQKRITITGSVINNSDNVFFLVTGGKKSTTVGNILNKRGDYRSYPASLVSPEEGNLSWYLDRDAASNFK